MIPDPRSPIPSQRSRWFRICCGAFFVAFSGAICFRYFSPRTTLTEGVLSSSVYLRVDPNALSVGTVWSDQILRQSMVVTNATSRPITVKRISADCSCTQVTPGTFELAPGASQDVDATIDLARTHGPALGRTRMRLSPSFEFMFKGGGSQSVKLSGEIASPFAAPSAIRIQREIADGEAPVAERFTVWKDSMTKELDVTVDPSEATLVEIPGAATADAVTFELTPHPARSPGKFAFDIQIRATSSDGRVFGPHPVRVSGRVTADITWSPEDVTLVQIDSGIAPREDVVFWLRSDEPLSTLEVIAVPEFVHATASLAEDSKNDPSGLLTLTMTKETATRTAGTVLVRVRDRSRHEWKISIPVIVQPLLIQPHGEPFLP